MDLVKRFECGERLVGIAHMLSLAPLTVRTITCNATKINSRIVKSSASSSVVSVNAPHPHLHLQYLDTLCAADFGEYHIHLLKTIHNILLWF